MSKPQQKDADDIKSQFTEENFRTWLDQFTRRQIVGQSYNTDERPLARFLEQQVGHHAIVMPVRTNVGNCTITNPPWARAFIHEIDKSKPDRIQKGRAVDTLDDLDWTPGDRIE